jgi:hypothetical protein
MGLDNLRSEIAFMRLQVSRQRKEILLLQREGLVLPARPSHHGCHRSVRREGVGQPRILLNKPYGIGGSREGDVP